MPNQMSQSGLMTSSEQTVDTEREQQTDVDAVVVGAGFSGLYMLHRLRDELGLSATLIEKGEEVGGTWYWNQYPGARCDSESHIYCYSFSDKLLEEWEWTERYPEQSEIQNYLKFATDHLDLRRDIQFDTEVSSATFDEDTGTWEVETSDGSRVRTKYFVSAVGCLSKPFVPEFDGLDSFDGQWYHTSRWPDDPVDFSDKRVGLIGTGSTGIQIAPQLAEKASELKVFQRTPNYAVPAQNRPLEEGEFEEIKRNYDSIWEDARESETGWPVETQYETAEGLSQEEIDESLEEGWQKGGAYFANVFGDLITNKETNDAVCEFVRSKIRETVDDPEVAEKLVPTDHPYGAKRPPRSFGYYETYNEEHVSLVDVDEAPIERITPDGIQTTEDLHDLDVIVFATGFDAVTGAVVGMDIEGRNGLSLEEKWEAGPQTYLGLASHGFPNLFMVTGPQSPSVLTNMPQAIEQHVEWISDCIDYMDEQGLEFVEPERAAEQEWVKHTTEVANQQLITEADSWYKGANVPGKPSTFLVYSGGLKTYREICNDVVESDYEGFVFASSLATLAEESRGAEAFTIDLRGHQALLEDEASDPVGTI